MSKKTLLNEATVRQFMKYADIGGLAQGFVNEMYAKEDSHYWRVPDMLRQMALDGIKFSDLNR